jgi:hypothetical protein
MQSVPPGLEHNPFMVFTFLAAPAILTNASTLMTLSTSNRLARSVDRMRAIADVILTPEVPGHLGGRASLTRALAIEQFQSSSRRCRVLIRALRSCYVAVGSFATGTCVAMLGASLSYFQIDGAARACVLIMLIIAGIGMLALASAAVFLISETTSTLDLLASEERSIATIAPEALGGQPAPK